MRLINLIGAHFGRLTVLSRSENKHGRTYWHCKCNCGNEKDISRNDLQRGTIQSCGCLRKKTVSKRRTTHGRVGTRLYYIWCSMKQRCENPKSHKAKDYYERGITICHEWHNFIVFQEWALNNGYADNLTIDRKDNDKSYFPENCHWTNNKTQANNKRNSRNITFNGETHTVAQWAEKLGMAYNVLHNRLDYLGWSIDRAITTPIRKRSVV